MYLQTPWGLGKNCHWQTSVQNFREICTIPLDKEEELVLHNTTQKTRSKRKWIEGEEASYFFVPKFYTVKKKIGIVWTLSSLIWQYQFPVPSWWVPVSSVWKICLCFMNETQRFLTHKRDACTTRGVRWASSEGKNCADFTFPKFICAYYLIKYNNAEGRLIKAWSTQAEKNPCLILR